MRWMIAVAGVLALSLSFSICLAAEPQNTPFQLPEGVEVVKAEYSSDSETKDVTRIVKPWLDSCGMFPISNQMFGNLRLLGFKETPNTLVVQVRVKKANKIVYFDGKLNDIIVINQETLDEELEASKVSETLLTKQESELQAKAKTTVKPVSKPVPSKSSIVEALPSEPKDKPVVKKPFSCPEGIEIVSVKHDDYKNDYEHWVDETERVKPWLVACGKAPLINPIFRVNMNLRIVAVLVKVQFNGRLIYITGVSREMLIIPEDIVLIATNADMNGIQGALQIHEGSANFKLPIKGGITLVQSSLYEIKNGYYVRK